MLRGIKVDENVWHGGYRDKDIGADEASEDFGGEVFINNGVDTFITTEDFGAIDWDTATARGNDNGAVLCEADDGFFLDNINRNRRGDDAAVTAAGIFFHDPVFIAGEFFGFGGGVELADRLGWVFEGRVVFRDDDLRNDAHDLRRFATGDEGIVNSLRKPVADLTLTHGDGSFERHGGSFVGGGGLFVD